MAAPFSPGEEGAQPKLTHLAAPKSEPLSNTV
jgi:hypothetical protein